MTPGKKTPRTAHDSLPAADAGKHSATIQQQQQPRIGLIQGSGAARGWSHIGVIRALEKAGIKPDLVCGTSIGALVGAAYAAGELDRFEAWVKTLRVKDILSFMDIHLSGGMLKGERLMEFFRRHFVDCPIEELPLPYGAVATALHNGAEIWLRSGSITDAVRASIALPGLFSPVWHENSILVDGGLVNPVPVSLARAMGADILIAVDLNAKLMGRHLTQDTAVTAPTGSASTWLQSLQQNLGSWMPESGPRAPRLPSMLDVMASSINIMQVRITRSRMAGEPPDLLIAPNLATMGLMDFHMAEASIQEGMRATEVMLPQLHELLGQSG